MGYQEPDIADPDRFLKERGYPVSVVELDPVEYFDRAPRTLRAIANLRVLVHAQDANVTLQVLHASLNTRLPFGALIQPLLTSMPHIDWLLLVTLEGKAKMWLVYGRPRLEPGAPGTVQTMPAQHRLTNSLRFPAGGATATRMAEAHKHVFAQYRRERQAWAENDVYDRDLDPMLLLRRDLGAATPPSRYEQQQLIQCVRAGGEASQAARHALVVRNARLVLHIARKYRNCGLGLSDLVQEGFLGLMRAIDKYEPTHESGASFSTYAVYWIRQSITRALVNSSRLIHLPIYVSEAMREVRAIVEKLAAGLGRPPHLREIALEWSGTGLSQEDRRTAYVCLMVGVALPASIETALSDAERRLAVWQAADTVPLSLDAPLPGLATASLIDYSSDEMYTDTLKDVLPERPQVDQDWQVERFGMRRALEYAFRRLTKREVEILESRFGFPDGDERTLQSVGDEQGVTRERIRQIVTRALRVLREPRSQLGEFESEPRSAHFHDRPWLRSAQLLMRASSHCPMLDLTWVWDPYHPSSPWVRREPMVPNLMEHPELWDMYGEMTGEDQ